MNRKSQIVKCCRDVPLGRLNKKKKITINGSINTNNIVK